MSLRRYELAVDLIKPEEWRRFETFGQLVLAGEFAGFRPTAAASGDRGRDGELYSGPDPTVMFQLSVANDWRQKIRATARRISTEFPDARVLVYVTNQRTDVRTDELRTEIRRDQKLFLDVRDRDWILQRVAAGGVAEIAAEELAAEIVDPHLADGATRRHATVLTEGEGRAGLTYLELRWTDDTREKGLTRLAFEGLVRSVLRGTDADHRMTRTEVRARMHALLPTHDVSVIDRFTDAALGRLTRVAISHWRSKDEFCLSYEERLRLSEGIAQLEVEERDLREVVADRVSELLEPDSTQDAIDESTERVRRVLDKFLISRGEAFAQSVTSGNLRELELSALKDFVLSDMGEYPPDASREVDPRVIQGMVTSLLLEPEEKVHGYLGRLAGSYTLFAFLHETPDVQSAVTKMFSGGDVALDSSVILPLLADTLEDDSHRHFTALINASRDSGISLWTTPGAIEEVERHLNRVMICSRTPTEEWRGDYPYLYGRYLESGRALGRISGWVETFVGTRRREEDLQLYLSEVHHIETRVIADVETADPALWEAALAEWQRVQEARSDRRLGRDNMMTLRLARHDAESYVAILGSRQRTVASPFGYSSWWLTLDRGAWSVHVAVATTLHRRDMSAPMMSPDFLRNYLAFGPLRRLVPRSLEATLPVVADVQLSQYVPPALVAIANEVRLANQALPERVIRRRVRDALDLARLRQGRLARGGLRDLKDGLEAE